MKKVIVNWVGLVFVLSLMMAACIGTSPTAYTEEPKSAESVATEEPTAESVVTQEPTAETVVTEEPTAESVATKEPTVESVVTDKPKTTGPRTGDIAPDFTLPDSNGNMVHLADELNDNRMVVLVFYHDSW